MSSSKTMEGESLVSKGKQSNGRLVVVSNREPYSVKVKDHVVCLEKAPGGLISALEPVLKDRGGLWICWEGAPKRIEGYENSDGLVTPPDLSSFDLPYNIETVSLTEKEINHYYHGYANARLWPLFHYFVSHCNFMDEQDWPNYYSANRKFAQAVLKHTTDDDFIWVQDYHLFLVPHMVREDAPNRKMGFFCHIPFPQHEIFRVLPKREEILEGMLGSDLIGFHTPEYANYFLEAVSHILSPSETSVDFRNRRVYFRNRVIQVGDFPISIDFAKVAEMADSPDMKKAAEDLKRNTSVEFLGIGVDRMDYSKGIFERLEAIRRFFHKYPDFKKRLTFVQISAPTRTEVDAYRQLKEQIDQAVGRINGEMADGNWVPIQYFYRSFSLAEIIPYFLSADFALVTPLRDGMNLVAKEYCAAKTNNSGTLILSELAGVSSELTQALIVNPYSPEDVADEIHRALTMSEVEKSMRMRFLRRIIARYDIHYWVKKFMDAFDDAVHFR